MASMDCSTQTPIQIHIPPSIHKHAIPLTSFLQTHPQYSNLAIGAFIFHPPPSSLLSVPSTSNISPPRLLIVQRASSERAFPNRWEVPGGSSEVQDPTILHSAARETFEETGLKLTRFVREIGKGVEFGSRKKRWVKLSFEVEVQELLLEGGNNHHGPAIVTPHEKTVDGGEHGHPGGYADVASCGLPNYEDVVVTLDPVEHQRYKWVTETELRELADRIITSEQFDVMLQAFALKKMDER
ncbi:MAG: hypothetical protein Q9163_000488 [Psora crenata]